MEENKAKTTAAGNEACEPYVDGADAGAVTSVKENAENEIACTEAPRGDVAVGEEETTPKNHDVDKSGSVASSPTAEEVNRANARRRREEARERELQGAREEAIIEALDGINPYTGEAMKDASDVQKFLSMKEERRDKGAVAPQVGTEEWFVHDREAFRTAHPDVSMEDLIRDPRFQTFSEGKVGHLPMEEIWTGYRRFLAQFDEKALNLAAQSVANRLSSPGSLGGGDAAQSDYFSPDRVRGMSSREVHENFEKIRLSMEKW